MRPMVGGVLVALWALIIAAYTSPIWIPGTVALEAAVEPPLPLWLERAVIGVVVALPALLLVAVTFVWWRWLGRSDAGLRGDRARS